MPLRHLIVATLALAAGAVLPAADQSAGSAGGTAASQSALSQEDHDFVTKAAVGGLFGVESAKLAQTKKLAPEPQQLAQTILTDHTAANAELQAFAQAKGIDLPTSLDETQLAKLEELRTLDGSAFEEAFHKTQISAHQMAITDFTKAAKDSQDTDLRAWAGKTLPTLMMHQKHLESGHGTAHGMEGSSGTHSGYSF